VLTFKKNSVSKRLISTLDGGQASTSAPDGLTPDNEVPVPSEQGAGWTPEAVRTLFVKEKHLV
jgi:hypothetical protein